MSDKSYRQLSESECHAIALGLQQRLSLSAIARALGRKKVLSAVNACETAAPRAMSPCMPSSAATGVAALPALAPNCTLTVRCLQSCALYLCEHWSPQQITGHLKNLHSQDACHTVSHETICTCIYAQPRGELKKELSSCLRMAHAKRWPRFKGQDRCGQALDLQSIHVRPPSVEDRQLPRH